MCRDLAGALELAASVDFPGRLPQEEVARAMQGARAFVQHSVTASTGDAEGTPVAILEAGASGLPVVATRHTGIAESVVEDETGFLVDERDVGGMAEHMIRLAREPELAAEIGAAARERVVAEYSMERRNRVLHDILAEAAASG
jgi:glycosyltransferase involved in cell wall biosynthesis